MARRRFNAIIRPMPEGFALGVGRDAVRVPLEVTFVLGETPVFFVGLLRCESVARPTNTDFRLARVRRVRLSAVTLG